MTPEELRNSIDNDQALASKRKMLIGLSLLLLAIHFTGAKIEEANTFIFKITFEDPQGLGDLILISVGFLLIRYYSHARLYHELVQTAWIERLKNDYFFIYKCPYSEEDSGYIVDIAPSWAGYNDDSYRYDETIEREVEFKPLWFFNSRFLFELYNKNHDDYTNSESVSLIKLSKPIQSYKAMKRVAKHWFEGQIRYRESLDIYAPYWIAFVACGLVVIDKIQPL